MRKTTCNGLFHSDFIAAGNPCLAATPEKMRHHHHPYVTVGKILPSIFCASACAAASAAVERYDHGDPTPWEQLMLELVNRARADPPAEAARLGIDLNAGLAAGTITPEPKPPLAFHPLLIDAAVQHSLWMLATSTFSHIGQAGSTPQQRMATAGYAFFGGSSSAENIAAGSYFGEPNMAAQTHDRHDALVHSPGHRVNLFRAGIRDVGIGIRNGAFQGGTWVMATQNFAASGGQPHRFVTGVVYKDHNGNGLYDAGEGLSGVTVTPEGGSWEAVTSTSGGYAVPYSDTSGSLRVLFSGGPLERTEWKEIERTGNHVKLDLVPSPFAEIVPGSLVRAGTAVQLQAVGTPGLTFRLQHSENLVDWEDAGTHEMPEEPLTLSHDSPLFQGFYRLKW